MKDVERTPSHESRASDLPATRVDAPHVPDDRAAVLERFEAPSAEVLRAVAGRDGAVAIRQLERQTGQLAANLQSRQRDLARRESELNAQLAAFESEMRTTRLIVREREEQLLRQVQRKETPDPADAAEDKAEVCQPPTGRPGPDDVHEIQRDTIRRWRASLLGIEPTADTDADAVASMDVEPPVIPRSRVGQRLEATAARMKQREQVLDESEALLDQQLRQLRADRQQLEQERSRLDHEKRDQQSRLARLYQEAAEELQTKRNTLERRRQQLVERRAALEQMHADVTQLHREALEMRLVTEELWVRLQGAAPAAELTQSLSQLRRRLAEHYEQSHQSLAQRQLEVERMQGSAARQREQLRHERQQLEQWIRQRNDEIEQQAARLVARQRQLEHQERQMRQQERHWEDQRRQYQDQLSRLLGQLRRGQT